jgi:hypothetical protein
MPGAAGQAEKKAAGQAEKRGVGQAEKEVRIRLALMEQLEASLVGSRKALLALDLPGIERGTREQVALLGAIGRVRAGEMGNGWRSVPEGATDLQADLRNGEIRVREAARLQAALLARSRAKLRVLGNMLADPSVNYGPLPSVRSSAPLPARDWKRGERAGAI